MEDLPKDPKIAELPKLQALDGRPSLPVAINTRFASHNGEEENMFWHQAGIIIFTATMMAGCASAPTAIKSERVIDQAVNVDQSSNDGPVGLEGYLDGVHPDRIAKCHKVAQTGSRLRRIVCEPKKDDRDLLGIIDAGGTYRHPN